MLASSIDTELFWAFRIEGRKPCRQKWRVNWLKISLEIFNFDKANVYQKGSFNGLICAFVKYARFFYLVYCGSLRPPPCSLLKYRINMFKISNALYTSEEFMFNMKITFKSFWTIKSYTYMQRPFFMNEIRTFAESNVWEQNSQFQSFIFSLPCQSKQIKWIKGVNKPP